MHYVTRRHREAVCLRVDQEPQRLSQGVSGEGVSSIDLPPLADLLPAAPCNKGASPDPPSLKGVRVPWSLQ